MERIDPRKGTFNKYFDYILAKNVPTRVIEPEITDEITGGWDDVTSSHPH